MRKHTAAAATWSAPWKAFREEYPEMANQLQVKWETASLPNNSWIVRQDVPAATVAQFKTLLLSLHESAEGRRLLQRLSISRFEPASNDTYLPVTQFLEDYAKQVRGISW